MATRRPGMEFGGIDLSGPLQELTAEERAFNGFAQQEATPEQVEDPSFLRSAGDTAIAATTGATTGVKMLSDVFGASNPVSETLGSFRKWQQEGLSDYRQAELRERAKLIEEAEQTGGVGDQVGAYMGHMADAPFDTMVNAAGTALPTILAAIFTGGASAGAQAGTAAARLSIAIAPKVATIAVGGAQGAGAAKGEIFDAVKQGLMESGVPEAEAAARAGDAQSYMGEHAKLIIANGMLGGVAGRVGVERAILGQSGPLARASARMAGTRAGNAAAGAIEEGVTEGLQGGLEKFSGNVAQMNEGLDVSPMQGVVGSAALESVAGTGLGAGAGAMRSPDREMQLPSVLDRVNGRISPTAAMQQAAADPVAPDDVGNAVNPDDPRPPEFAELDENAPPVEGTEVRPPQQEQMEMPDAENTELALDRLHAQADADIKAQVQRGSQDEPAKRPRAQTVEPTDNMNAQSAINSIADTISDEDAYLARRGKTLDQQGPALTPDELSEMTKKQQRAADLVTDPVDAAAHDGATSPLNDRPEPTQAQKEAGNYKVGRIKVAGLPISIENAAGSSRKGVDPGGKAWERELTVHYGYVRGTEASDGDHVDVMIKPGTAEDYTGEMFVIDQVDPRTGKFDEPKVVIGPESIEEAQALYREQYDKDWDGIGGVTSMDTAEFKEWLNSDQPKRATSAALARKLASPAGDTANQPEVSANEEVSSTPDAADRSTVDAVATPSDDKPKKRRIQKKPKTRRTEADDHQVAEPVQSATSDTDSNVVRTADSTTTYNQPKSTPGSEAAAVQSQSTDVVATSPAAIVGKENTQSDSTEPPDSSAEKSVSGAAPASAAAPAKKKRKLRTKKTKAPQATDNPEESAEPEQSAEKEKQTSAAPAPAAEAPPDTDATVSETVTLFRGTKKDRSPDSKTSGDGLFMSPNEQVAKDYAGAGGKVIEHTISFKNLLKADTWHDAKPKLGLPKATYMDDLIIAARNAGYDGLQFKTKNGPEYIVLDKELAAESNAKPIDDFGEKIGGARKDLWTGFKDSLSESVSAEKIASQPLSKIWPQPDYQKLLDEGVHPRTVSLIRAARDQVPAKPRVQHKVSRWADQVTMLREVATQALSGHYEGRTGGSLLKALGMMEKPLPAVVGRADLYMAVGHEKSLQGITLDSGMYSMIDGVEYSPPKIVWAVEQKTRVSNTLSNFPVQIVTADTREGAIESFKAKFSELNIGKATSKEVSFGIYSKRGSKGYWIGKKIGRNVQLFDGPFESIKEARQRKTDNQAELVEKLKKFREIPQMRRDTNEPRAGEDMRSGQDVTPELFAQTFAFRGVEFGNWVEQGKRQSDLNNTFDSLMDLAAVVDVPPQALSLSGELGLAFGARGTGGRQAFAAHYEPDAIAINLTKKAGAGSLGHEWWHALDNYFNRRSDAPGYASERPARTMRPELQEAFTNLRKAIVSTKMVKRSQKMDGRRSKPYWATEREMSARAFEAYLIAKLQDQEVSNDYLANVVDEKSWDAMASMGMELDSSYPYPTIDEMPTIREAFDNLFQVVETKADGDKVALFNLSDTNPEEADASVERVQAIADQLAASWTNRPEITVLPSFDDADKSMQADLSPDAKGRPMAAHRAGHIYLFADELKTDHAIATSLFHEAFGHYGIQGLLGKDLNAVMDDVAKRRPAAVRAKVKEYGWDYRDSALRRKAAEEVLAEAAQHTPELDIVQRAIAAIRNWLRSLGVPLALSNHDIIQSIIEPARKFVQSGAPKAGHGTRVSFHQASPNPIEPSDAAQAGTAAQISDVLHQAWKNRTTNGKAFKWWRGINTQYHKATLDADFSKVFRHAQAFTQTTNRVANKAADMAPHLLPKLGSIRDLVGPNRRKGLKQEDQDAVSKALFSGTLIDSDPTKGKVYTEKELADEFGLNEKQIDMYFEGRNAIDTSLHEIAKAHLQGLGYGRMPFKLRQQIRDARDMDHAMEILKENHEHLKKSSWASYEQIEAAKEMVEDGQQHVSRVQALIDGGYAPLSRFGQYGVWIFEVNEDAEEGDSNIESLYFSAYDSLASANKDAAALYESIKEDHPNAILQQGVMSQKDYELFAGISPDTLEVFGSSAGFDGSPEWRAYIELVKSNRSSMKRMLERKGTPGYSEDLPRVLAHFVTSNARSVSASYHMKDMLDAAENISQEKGDVKDDAIALVKYLQNPVEEAAAIRGLMFTWFLGGSIASAAVNMTQSLTMTMPYLAVKDGALGAGQRVTAAAMEALRGAKDHDMAQALEKAAEDGVVEPQEIHALTAEVTRSRGKSLNMRKALFAWGYLFQQAEVFNRRTAFIASYRQAKENGSESPYFDAKDAVEATQGIYSRENRVNIGRGAVGSVVMTFKQYSIAYIEFVARLLKNKESRPAGLLALGVLVAISGLSGLPFMEDLDDVIDTLAQAAGYNFQVGEAKEQFMADVFGEQISALMMRGASGIPGAPIDVQQRLGMGNLIPGTGAFLKSNRGPSREVLEMLGPAAGMAKQLGKGTERLLAGEPVGALKSMMPVALTNAYKAYDMATLGMYRDTRGRRVVDTNGFEAIFKGMGFQPASVAAAGRTEWQVQSKVNINRRNESEIAGLWAEGLFEKDDSKIERARSRLTAWNEKNPQFPIRITRSQLKRRVKAMSLTRSQRIRKAAPREIRATAAAALASDR